MYQVIKFHNEQLAEVFVICSSANSAVVSFTIRKIGSIFISEKINFQSPLHTQSVDNVNEGTAVRGTSLTHNTACVYVRVHAVH